MSKIVIIQIDEIKLVYEGVSVFPFMGKVVIGSQSPHHGIIPIKFMNLNTLLNEKLSFFYSGGKNYLIIAHICRSGRHETCPREGRGTGLDISRSHLHSRKFQSFVDLEMCLDIHIYIIDDCANSVKFQPFIIFGYLHFIYFSEEVVGGVHKFLLVRFYLPQGGAIRGFFCQ